jgi:hypothetical protein
MRHKRTQETPTQRSFVGDLQGLISMSENSYKKKQQTTKQKEERGKT